MCFFSTVASDEVQEEALAFTVKKKKERNLRMKTNWGKSQLPPEIFTADCLPLLAWRDIRKHISAVSTLGREITER